MNSEWSSRYDLAVNAAKMAGDYARTIYETTFDVIIKSDASPVTIADRNAEAKIRELVAMHFPNDGVLGEEYGDTPGSSGYRWILDPVDGTKSFVRKVPMWGTLVGLEFRDEPIAGVVYMPNYGELWRALRGDGCYHHDRRVRVSDVSKLSESFLCYSALSWFEKNNRQKEFLKLSAMTDRQRGYGDFYGFCLVAQGSVDIMIDNGVHAWDVAAIMPLIEEAGGKFSTWNGTRTIHQPDVIATNGKLHDEVRGILAGN